MKTEYRNWKRYPVARGRIRASWLTREGAARETDVRVVNVSRRGLAIQVPEAMPAAAIVRLRSAQQSLHGPAVVRYCKFSGTGYLAGVEFQPPNEWTAPDDAASENGTVSLWW